MTQSFRAGGAICVCIVLCLVLVRQSRAGEVHNDELGFSITIPDDFQAAPALKTADMLYLYTRGVADQPGFEVIQVARTHKPLKHEKIDLAKIQEQLPDATAFTVKWDNAALDGIQATRAQGGTIISSQTVCIPLLKEAIAITISGDPANDAARRQILQNLVASVKGQSSWAESPGDKAVSQLTEMIGTIVAVVLIYLATTNKKRRQVRAAKDAAMPPKAGPE